MKGTVATRQVDSRGSFPLLSHQIDAPPLKLLKRSRGAKKSLAFGQEKKNLANVDAHLDIKGLLNKPTTQMKTAIVYWNSNVECRSSFSHESASIIINISKRKTVANTVFMQEIKA